MKVILVRCVFLAVLTVFFGILAVLAGCETARDRGATGVGALVDCEAPNLKAAVAELLPLVEQAVKSWIGGDGKVDTTKMRAACAAIVGTLGRCLTVSTIAALTAPAASSDQTVIVGPLQVPDPGALRAAFEVVRSDWGGASYKTAAGTL